ncbi:MAG: RluA family pseudouridine synthase, partial [Dehalococcoidia bacterium]|nr:RluA family pseudouridine synthase [Dehalococcoidia bacterium]
MGEKILHTPLCDMLGIRYPILQAGMGGNTIRGLVANPELAAAVSEADAAAIQATVLHRDATVIVLNKPPGLAVQGGTNIR